MPKKRITISTQRKRLEKQIERLMETIELREELLRKAEKALEALKSRCKHKRVSLDDRFATTCPECGFRHMPV